MRIPESIDEYQHMLNANGWQKEKKRKVGTLMRKNDPREFYGSLIAIVNIKIEELSEEIEKIENADSPLPTHKIRASILEKQIKAHKELVAEAEEALAARV